MTVITGSPPKRRPTRAVELFVQRDLNSDDPGDSDEPYYAPGARSLAVHINPARSGPSLRPRAVGFWQEAASYVARMAARLATRAAMRCGSVPGSIATGCMAARPATREAMRAEGPLRESFRAFEQAVTKRAPSVTA